MAEYYQAGSFMDNSPISDIKVGLQVPAYRCPDYEQDSINHYYCYPHLDATEVLSRVEVAKMGPKMRKLPTDSEVHEIVWRLRRKWNIPVAAGIIFGPTQVKVTTKPKADFYVLVGHSGLFCKAVAFGKLKESGISADFVQTPATGKYAGEANYVEIYVPVLGRQLLPPDRTFCHECLRYFPGGNFKAQLIRKEIPAKQLFFRTIEGTIIFSESFIKTVHILGLTGFVEGKTLLPVPVVD